MNSTDNKNTLLFLDIETTGLSSRLDTILSLGMISVSPTGECHEFYKEIDVDFSKFKLSDKARELNLELLNNSLRKYPLSVAEREAVDFLRKHNREKFKLPIGYNISSFDMGFIKEHMPILYTVLGYRSMCINALISFYALKTNENFWEVKSELKKVIEKQTGVVVTHNALEDCRQTYETYKFIDKLFIARTGE